MRKRGLTRLGRRLSPAARLALAAVGVSFALGGLPATAQSPPLPGYALPVPPAPPERLPPAGVSPAAAVPQGDLPPDFIPWWQDALARPLVEAPVSLAMSLDQVILDTLRHSPQVRAISDTPIIRRTAIVQAQSRFDPVTFAESKWVDTSDPVGNLLTTGGASRFLDQNWYYSGGVRKRMLLGTQLEASQRFGYQDNNSIFFVPAPQGTSRMTLNLTQPLLQGAGRKYNSSLIVLADIDASIAYDQLSQELQALLLDVHKTYWELYVQRAGLLQRKRLHQEAVDILEELNARREIDVLGSQIVRAQAAVASRQSAVIRFATGVRNAESKLRAIINNPALNAVGQPELVPCDLPNRVYLDVPLEDSLVAALKARPEINQATKEVRAAGIRAEVSKNELLPVLSFIMGTYVYGLSGNSDIGQSFINQYTLGRPTYSAGLTWEMPWRNRNSKGRLQQRRLELRQATSQLEATVANVRSEVEIAVREVAATYREMVARHHAVAADEAEIRYLLERWRLLPGDQQVAGVVLDNVLVAQERRADAELGLATALAAYNVALVNLNRATGTLLDCELVTQGEACDEGLPTLLWDRSCPRAQPPSEARPPLPGPYDPRRSEAQPGVLPAPIERLPADPTLRPLPPPDSRP